MGACGASCGITRAREREKDLARAVSLRAWPGGRGDRPAWSPDARPVDRAELSALAVTFSEILPARCVLSPAEDDGADFLYLVATTRETTWVGFRDGLDASPPEEPEERAIRVGFSALGRFATLQEVSMRAERDADGLWIEERRARGVEDRRLQVFVRAAQGALRKARVTVLDAAFLAEPVAPEGMSGWEALFERDPPVTTRGVWIPQRA